MKHWFKEKFTLFLLSSLLVVNACVTQNPQQEQAVTTTQTTTTRTTTTSGPSQEEFKEARYQQELIIDNKKDSLDKLIPVAFNVLEANVDLCGEQNTVLSYGFFTDISQLLSNDSVPVPPLTSSKNFTAPVQIIYVTSSGPASGRLQRNDKILEINDVKLDGSLSENYMMLAKTIAEGSLRTTKFKIEREEQQMDVEVKPVKLCNYPVYLNQNGNLNAYSDGHSIFVNSSIVNLADTPDKIALIIGHEMAHNRMNHRGKRQGNIIVDNAVSSAVGILTGIPLAGMITKIGGPTQKAYEEEADYFGTYYAARAGYDISHSFEIWRQLAVSNPASLHLEGSTHPSTAKRFLAIKRTVAEINKKLKTGVPIEPSVDMVEQSEDGYLSVNSRLLPFNQ